VNKEGVSGKMIPHGLPLSLGNNMQRNKGSGNGGNILNGVHGHKIWI
jgi:hypothetical protein